MNILVVAAHPDDEVLGLGGTLAKLVKEGDTVYAAIFANDTQVRYKEKMHGDLIGYCHNSCSILGLQPPIFLDFPDQKLDTLPQIVLTQAIEKLVNDHDIEHVYTHHHGDINKDHRALHHATMVATRPGPKSNVKRVFTYCVPSSTDWAPFNAENCFFPNWFVDISATIEIKLDAVSQYQSETPPYPHPRSIDAIRNHARYWGSSVGFEHAEPFTLVRNLVTA